MNGRMMKKVNWIDVVLIAKQKGPIYVSHFKFISLCNFCYKVISKIMVNRIQPFLGSLSLKIRVPLLEKGKFMTILLRSKKFSTI